MPHLEGTNPSRWLKIQFLVRMVLQSASASSIESLQRLMKMNEIQ